MTDVNVWKIMTLISFPITLYMFFRARKQDKPKQPICGWLFKAEYDDANLRFNNHISDILKIFEHRANNVYKNLLKAECDGIIYQFPAIAMELSRDISIHNFVSPHIDLQTDSSALDENFLKFCTDELGKKLTNNPTFRLTSFQKKQITVSLSTYYQTLSTCDIHHTKFIANMPSKKELDEDTPNALTQYMTKPFFTQWQEQVNKIIVDKQFCHYSASLGCSVLTLFKDKRDGYCFYIIANSSEKNGSNDGHVIPSFMYQPTSKDINRAEKELALNFQVLREFGEEILGMDELESPNVHRFINLLDPKNNIKKTQTEEQISKLAELLQTNKAELFITGMIVDAFKLRPELTLLLLIHDDEFMSTVNPKGSWESSKCVNQYKLNEYKRFINRDNGVPLLCAPGIAALVNGIEYVKNNNLLIGEQL